MPRRLKPLSTRALAILAFAIAGAVMLAVAFAASLVVESRSARLVSARLSEAGLAWVSVATDGMQVHLSGTAPDEAARFRALNLTGGLIDVSRLRDRIEVAPAMAMAPPRFSVEMLRNDDGIQLIGLFPATPSEGGLAQDALSEAANTLAPDTEIVNMLQTADYPAPEGWDPALRLGLEALNLLTRSKISVAAGEVKVTAISASAKEKSALEAALTAKKPEGVALVLDISAPRPVITPFTLRFLIDSNGARFDACSADTEEARNTIHAAAAAAGADASAACVVGMGSPSPRWAEAVAATIQAVSAMGAGSVTFSDADITLTAGEGVAQAGFEAAVGDLRALLPDAFSLEAIPPKVEVVNQGPAEFTATLSPEGRVLLRGRLVDDSQQAAVEAFAQGAFGAAKVHTATVLDPDLPDGWPIRVLAGLDSLAQLHDGSLLVRADRVEVKGVTGNTQGQARITQILSSQLGQGAVFAVDVRYDKELDPYAALPTPEECAKGVSDVVARQKITFTPGSAELAREAAPVIEALAKVLKHCAALPLEIGGHTDSQGSEGGNLALSQARAEAVLIALEGRRVDVAAMTAVGYGESVPIADNAEEAGREANRRIEFVLKGAAQAPGVEPPADVAADVPENATGGAGAGPDFSGDQSPSVAPTRKTIRPKPRPERQG